MRTQNKGNTTIRSQGSERTQKEKKVAFLNLEKTWSFISVTVVGMQQISTNVFGKLTKENNLTDEA